MIEDLEPIARHVRDSLGTSGQRAWLVGGVVRDALLGRELEDIDLVVDGDPGTAARAWAKVAGGTPFELSDRFGCWRVADPRSGAHLDVCACRNGSIEADLALRDFTINAMAVACDQADELVDPAGGADDLRRRLVRMVAPQALDDDPLRLLRGARIAHVLGFDIEQATRQAVRQRAGRASEPSGERIFAELCLLLDAPESRRALRLLDDLGLVSSLLPELEHCRGIEQSRYHHLDVYDHTLAVLDNCEDIAIDTGHYLGTPGHVPHAPLTAGRLRVLRFAALCHDLGKPGTHAVSESGHVSFLGHDATGVGIVHQICERWATSNRFRDAVVLLVRTHLQLGWLLHEPLDARASWRYRRTVEPWAAEAIVLSVADRLATAGLDDRRRWVRLHVSAARQLWADHWLEQARGVALALLDGSQIAEACGLNPGPVIGELVRALAEEQAVGAVQTPDQAVQFVQQRARRVSAMQRPAP